MKTCTQPGCEARHHARGWCRIHYQNWKRNGVPQPVQEQFRGSTEDRLRLYSRADGECLRWDRAHDEDGYGLVRFEGRDQRVHRAAYVIANGPIAPGYEVDHTCHTRDCHNLDHLRLVIHKQNAENRAGLRSTNTTGVVGVSKRPNGRYQAHVGHNYRQITVGTFDTLEEAADAARAKRLELFTHNDLDRMEVAQ